MKKVLKENLHNFKRNPWPGMSVKLKSLPPDMLFKTWVVALPTCIFLFLAATAKPIEGASVYCWLEKRVPCFFTPSENFFPCISKPATSG